MEPLIRTNTEEILNLLSQIVLKGEGFITDALVGEVLDAGLFEPNYLNVSGTDPNAFYNDEPNAWAVYHVSQGKKTFAVYGGENKYRTIHISADTPEGHP
ncbi:MAG: hypothetical protein AAB035_00025 [Nitrospirota bacterium]